jgi:hypothetical protein
LAFDFSDGLELEALGLGGLRRSGLGISDGEDGGLERLDLAGGAGRHGGECGRILRIGRCKDRLRRLGCGLRQRLKCVRLVLVPPALPALPQLRIEVVVPQAAVAAVDWEAVFDPSARRTTRQRSGHRCGFIRQCTERC